jgi:DNA-directed RNA polymerase specialized sigma subunit
MPVQEELWNEWKRTQNPESLNNLLKKYDGMIQSAVNKHDNPNIPRPAMEAEAKNQAFIAFETYDPNRGTQLSTHVGTRLKKLYSYMTKFQNVGKIPEGEASSIGTYKQAKEDLRKKFNREPSTVELADHLAWDFNRVSRMEASLRRDYIGMDEISAMETNPRFERMMYSYYEMTPEEQIIFDYTLGAHGKPKLTPGQIASRLGISNSKVSAIKNKIAKRMEEYGD